MSTRVETAIRTHLEANDAAQEPIEWSEIVTRLDTDTLPVAAPPRRRVWLVAVAAFAIVILVVGGLGLLFGGGEGSDPASPTKVEPVPTPTVDSPGPSAPITGPSAPTKVEPPITGLISGLPESVSYVATISFSSSLAREAAVSYLDADTWRMEVTEWLTDVSPPEQTGSRIFIRDGTDMFEYTALPNTFKIIDLTNECPPHDDHDDVPDGCTEAFYFDLLDPIADGSYPLQFKDFVCDEDGTCVGPGSGETAWADCSVETGGFVAGLETNYYMCQRDISLDGAPTQTQTLELWMGADSTTLKWIWTIPRSPGDETITSYEVSEIDQTPDFDPSLFEFECPTTPQAGSTPTRNRLKASPRRKPSER